MFQPDPHYALRPAKFVLLSPLPADPTHHSVVISGIQIWEAIPPDHASPDRNDSQRPVPNPKAQGCVPLIHWCKPQHETAELGGNNQTHPSPPPLPVGHSRVKESPALLKEMGSRAHAVRGGWCDYF
ncbi:hypothetical protein CRENBAI_003316 [Crenichthys baileyi]|uniref:Uncharacterized protein n=1 Tax=Crenichthys baileyi TaxID=28760 RepID=A0AAV9R3F0_9TELE